ncbi:MULTISPECIES: ATP-binding cassette domain-containing protein [unclassified Hydrogenobaculum]|jgi:phospholipid/cholesterol/gamma-HCH transport system ATP-binding protein|uniref:ABC transporter ATP-binding protein n=1 Tax=unclassified Hydrogenobaculum TaxID=2622382 RepID=UPI0001C50A65|nr:MULTISPECIES: ATP-binding cassette domain-containing protein [unclassified Hydrogenobaculum]AEF19709.1 Fe(3+)-transporting ATPase [Hydrogenobaculum sp. 3684]AEG46996.1 Fe(3+)-transporting ATPase [Hydrogenobaculum sp. SHO]AGG15644.1 ABC transporter related protein [Hydrogenobaculum sp. HO]AGH93943.1 ABC-type transport system involved in resistance to organic solvents, ATPase component [Hydrogenobaculum sp. SN]
MDIAIKVRNLTKVINNRTILKNISFDVYKKEVFTIIGGSGSGKTSITKHIIGLWQPTEGDIEIEGKSIVNLNKDELNKIRMKMGYVFQEGALFDSLRVWENVGFYYLEHTNKPKDEIIKIAIEKLKEVNLDESILYLMPSELSGGMRKRVSLARALATDPEIIIYDEPTSGLDPITSRIIDKLILDLKIRLGITSIVVTHDMVSALGISDRIMVLDKGEQKFLGTKEEFLNSKEPSVRMFLENAVLKI